MIIRCLKKKHHSDKAEYVVRFNEGSKKAVKNFTFTLGNGIETAYEAWGSEEYRNEAIVSDGKLICDFKPYEVKTFVFTLKAPAAKGEKPAAKALELTFNDDIEYIPKTLRRESVTACGIPFTLGDGAVTSEAFHAEAGEGKQLALLCTNFENNEFVNHAHEAFARWDLYDFGETAYIKKGKLGWEFTHTLGTDGEVQYARGLYFWVKLVDSSDDIPKSQNIVILAATEMDRRDYAVATPLMDEIENNRPFTFRKSLKEWLWYIHSKFVWNLNDKDDFLLHNNNGKNGKRIEQTGNRFETKQI